MDRTHDIEPAPPEAQAAPRETATPGRQPVEPGTQPAQPGTGAPGGARIPAQRIVTAMLELLAGISEFRSRAHAAYEPYKQAYTRYTEILTRRAQRAQLAQQIALQILFVGVGGAFGGVLQQIVKNYGTGAVNRAFGRASQGGLAVEGVATAAGDLLKDFLNSFKPGNAPDAGGSGVFDPEVMQNRILGAIEGVQSRGLRVMAGLSSAAERNEQLTSDPIATMQEVLAQISIPPQLPPPEQYLRQFFERNEWVRNWRAQVTAATHEMHMDRLWAHDRLFIADIEEVCPGLLSRHYREARERVRTQRTGERPRRSS